ncbi:Endoplasmic reticulum chaperone BiP [Entomophthora muscae]|uniref:Endoplasmic reticulum chaperone BiP n=1 Tax=Entomophthora muscae TaxID=34485 RepID=A0ACC2RY62_9FUNG|nr:Endoplasmic reticulum chaperone BiP [Entomophthora muscae]
MATVDIFNVDMSAVASSTSIKTKGGIVVKTINHNNAISTKQSLIFYTISNFQQVSARQIYQAECASIKVFICVRTFNLTNNPPPGMTYITYPCNPSVYTKSEVSEPCFHVVFAQVIKAELTLIIMAGPNSLKVEDFTEQLDLNKAAWLESYSISFPKATAPITISIISTRKIHEKFFYYNVKSLPLPNSNHMYKEPTSINPLVLEHVALTPSFNAQSKKCKPYIKSRGGKCYNIEYSTLIVIEIMAINTLIQFANGFLKLISSIAIGFNWQS